jgi:gamma-glutamylcyclotransferase (GGCT)/AIG2-like uncharacterized protein YtfP
VDTLIYFAYGSNMSVARLTDRTPSAKKIGTASIQGYQLKFHKLGSKDQSGKCNIFKTDDNNDVVHGVLYEIKREEKQILDQHEGLGYGYEEKIISVFSEDTEGHIEATTYYAAETHIDDTLLPYHWYKNFVVEGAKEHSLPDHYIQKLEDQDSKDDTNQARVKKNHNILKNDF